MIWINSLSFAYPGGGAQPAFQGADPGIGSGRADATYPCKITDDRVLADISLHLPRGALCWLLGVNGSGKSTLLSLLAGLLHPQKGTILLADGSPAHSPHENTAKRAFRAAFVPQNPDTYLMGSTVREDLLLSMAPTANEAEVFSSPTTCDPARFALNMAEEFGLAPLLDRPIHTLSYGQKRKLCLASALASAPDLLLLDEPFSGLDHPSALVMRQALARNKEAGLTQVITGHTLDLAGDIADTFTVLQAGRLVLEGSARTVFPQLEQYGIRPPCWWFVDKTAPLWAKA